MSKKFKIFLLFNFVLVTSLLEGCRLRHWNDDSGVLDDSQDRGEYSIRCFESFVDTTKPIWFFKVTGILNPNNRDQPIEVTIQKKTSNNDPIEIATKARGKGLVSDEYGIFLGYDSGALTADQLHEGRKGFYNGLLTITSNDESNVTDVFCEFKPM